MVPAPAALGTNPALILFMCVDNPLGHGIIRHVRLRNVAASAQRMDPPWRGGRGLCRTTR